MQAIGLLFGSFNTYFDYLYELIICISFGSFYVPIFFSGKRRFEAEHSQMLVIFLTVA